MSPLQSLSILLFIAALSAWLNHRYIKLPSAIGVMSVSLVFSMAIIGLDYIGILDTNHAITFISIFDFEQLLLHGMLAFLLFAGGLSIDLGELNSQKGVIAVLSTVGVVFSTFLVGLLYWLSLGLIDIEIPFIFALLFGAIVSPTDAVAVLGILKKVGVPKSLEVKVVGESLFNDGVGVVVFFAVSTMAFGKNISASEIAVSLSIEVLGGVILGLLLGCLAYRMLKAVDEYVVEILLTLALAAGGYALAERIHVSAPMCAVVAGLIVGNHGRAFAMSERTRQHLDTFWELIDELLNAVLFVLIGLEIITLTVNRGFILAGLFGICVVVISRLLSVWLSVTAMKKWRSFSPHAVKILAWGGLRGGISVALALSLPVGGFHDLLVISTYIVVLFSVLVQGSTLSFLLKFATRASSKTS